MKAETSPVYVRWHEDELGYCWPSLRDRSTGRLLEPFTSYLEWLVSERKNVGADPKGVQSALEHATYGLSALAAFLMRKKLSLWRITGEWLKDLREEMLADIKANPISRNKDHSAKRTANRKLVNIYKFLYWSQCNRRLAGGTIGWLNCRVRSSLPEADTRAAKVDLTARRLYPLCYERVGSSTRQDEGQYWATAEDLARIEDFFWDTHEFAIAERNSLALQIQKCTGWRNESVNSLRASQFSEERLRKQRASKFCLIRPPKQKFGYEKAFAVDWVLVDRIVEYIKNGRKQMLKKSGSNERKAEGRLFVAEHGGPLTDDTYGEIFADAFRAIGAPKGAGGHAIRRYRAVEEVRSEVSRMKTAGLPVDRQTIIYAVMNILGHNSEEAGRAYDYVHQVVAHESREAELWRRLQKAELERDSMRAKVATAIGELSGSLSQAALQRLTYAVGVGANSPQFNQAAAA